jgi:glycosyltransferase 2 family protein
VVSAWGAPSAVLCVLGNLNFVMAGALLGAALGLRVDATTYLACIPLAVAVTVIPISIAGWGLREGLLVSLLSHAGIRPDAALAFSLMFGLLSAACSLPGLVLWCVRSERVTAVLS